jgi:hypothetical protein
VTLSSVTVSSVSMVNTVLAPDWLASLIAAVKFENRRAGVVAGIGQRIATGMPQHVGTNPELEARLDAGLVRLPTTRVWWHESTHAARARRTRQNKQPTTIIPPHRLEIQPGFPN